MLDHLASPGNLPGLNVSNTRGQDPLAVAGLAVMVFILSWSGGGVAFSGAGDLGTFILALFAEGGQGDQ
ncbi:hypothetical protein [Mycobacterium dioxanotrophicus]|uniref:hypothetical protein n=1 Tax=Mycobacterium dioxanotrophicus TaxID=482462 RepID=UPI0012F9DBC6|nr:hypothetical protein [Mycobacterium dioxanotrophicus]